MEDDHAPAGVAKIVTVGPERPLHAGRFVSARRQC